MKYELTYKGNAQYYLKIEDAIRSAKRLSKVYKTVCRVRTLDNLNNVTQELVFKPLK